MGGLVEKPLAFVLRKAKGFVKSNGTTRKLLEDLANRDAFTSITAHEEMIVDSIRVDTYHAGIERHVKPGDVVVDLGTGTGILSFFAAAQGARKVYAIDHSEIINVAQTLAAHNRVTGVEFVRSHSSQFVPSEPVDVILHEQMGDDLFNEHMLDSILDLKRRVMKPGGKVLPARFEVYFEPIELHPTQRLPYLWEQNVHGVDYSILKHDPRLGDFKKATYEHRVLQPVMIDHFLCEPEPLLTLDLNTLEDIAEIPTKVSAQRTVAHSGRLDGVCVYFRTLFDDDLSFSTSPLEPMTSWSNRIFRTETREYAAGDRISYSIDLKRLSFGDTWSLLMDEPSRVSEGVPTPPPAPSAATTPLASAT